MEKNLGFLCLNSSPLHIPRISSPPPSFSPFTLLISLAPKRFLNPSLVPRHPILLSAAPAPAPPPSSSSTSYAGWDDLDSSPGPINNNISDFTRLRHFLLSLGIDDRKHLLFFFLGFVSSLAISRVKVSSMSIFPVSVLLFILGFSVGISYSLKEITPTATNIHLSRKDTHFRDLDHKLKCLRIFFTELDAKMSYFTTAINGILDKDSVQPSQVEKFLQTLESVRLDIASTTHLLEPSIDNNDWKSLWSHQLSSSNELTQFPCNAEELEKNSNSKISKSRREFFAFFTDFARVLMGGLLLENSFGWKPKEVRDSVEQEPIENSNSVEGINRPSVDAIQRSSCADKGEERGENLVFDNNVASTKVGPCPSGSLQNPATHQEDEVHGSAKIPHTPSVLPSQIGCLQGSGPKPENSEELEEMVKRNLVGVALANKNILDNTTSIGNGKQLSHSRPHNYGTDMFSYYDKFSNHGNGLKVRDDAGSDQNTSEAQMSQNRLCEPASFDVEQRKHPTNSLITGPNASFGHKDANVDIGSPSLSSQYRKNSKLMAENGTCGPGMKKGMVKTVKLEDQHSSNSYKPESNMEGGDNSSIDSDDKDFNRHLKEANNLLKRAKESLKGQADEKIAENLLHKSADLLSKAIAMKPNSLRAVGQLGNAFLLHGELKLKISRELRMLLSRSNSLLKDKEPSGRLEGSKTQLLTKDKVALVLVDVCEECEELLVEAGRKYKVALSIDDNDVKALYNWGLALSFRAQLIADIGPEAAFDADKLYLAAIDKYDALMSKSNTYAPNALFRWGQALQERSHLWSHSSKEKVKLLLQAKRLFEDALHLDPNSSQVREALSLCISELNYKLL